MRNAPHRFMNVKTRSLVGDTVWSGTDSGEVQLYCGSASLGVAFESL